MKHNDAHSGMSRLAMLTRAGLAMGRKRIAVVSTGLGELISEPRTPAAVYCATTMINMLALVLPLTILQVYDRVIPNRTRETLVLLFFGVAITLLLDLVLKIARSALLSWGANRFVCSLSDEAVARLLDAPDEGIEQHAAAVYTNRYSAIAALGEYHAGQSRLVSIDLPFAAISFTVMMLVGGTMVLVPVTLFFLFAAFAMKRNRQFRDVIKLRSEQDNKKYDFVVEALNGILTIKGMAMVPQMQRRFERLQQSVAEITSKSITIGQAAQSSAVLYGSLSQVVVVTVGAQRVIDDQLSMGALACCTMLSGQILQPLLRAISLWMEAETANHRRAEIAALLDLPAGSKKSPRNPQIDGPIQLDRVAFSYPDRPAAVLKDVSFSISPGLVAGLKGEDGSGRSTVLKIMCGELLPSSGRAWVSGVATTAPDFARMRQCFAYVGSSPVIFRGTILENLTLFRSERSMLARAMSSLVGLDAAINLLPDGFDTKLGEGIADDLPVSVAQQICIVRVFSTDASIVVLDEVNTVLDRAAEASLMRAIQVLRGRKTIIIATHRPSLLAMSDILLEVSGGRVVVSRPGPQVARNEVVA
jgi:ATP-binding cassette subfamily C protein LapB